MKSNFWCFLPDQNLKIEPFQSVTLPHSAMYQRGANLTAVSSGKAEKNKDNIRTVICTRGSVTNLIIM